MPAELKLENEESLTFSIPSGSVGLILVFYFLFGALLTMCKG